MGICLLCLFMMHIENPWNFYFLLLFYFLLFFSPLDVEVSSVQELSAENYK